MEGGQIEGIDLEKGGEPLVCAQLLQGHMEEETLVHKSDVLWGLCVQTYPVTNVCGFCDLLMTASKLLGVFHF